MYDGRAIANIILDHANASEVELSNLSLQKILFFCHAWFFVMTGKPLIRQTFEAWEFGPVLPDVYRELKSTGDKAITSRVRRLDMASGKAVIASCDIGGDQFATLAGIIDFYSRMPPSHLVELSHAPNGPWWHVWNHKGRANPGMRIENDQIWEYYSTRRGPIQ